MTHCRQTTQCTDDRHTDYNNDTCWHANYNTVTHMTRWWHMVDKSQSMTYLTLWIPHWWQHRWLTDDLYTDDNTDDTLWLTVYTDCTLIKHWWHTYDTMAIQMTHRRILDNIDDTLMTHRWHKTMDTLKQVILIRVKWVGEERLESAQCTVGPCISLCSNIFQHL